MMMHAGLLDRRVTIQRNMPVKNDYNEPVETFIPIGDLWARKVDASANERYRASEVAAEITTRFIVRWSNFTFNITPRDRLVWGPYTYNITGTRELQQGRREWIEIDCVARDDLAGVEGCPS
jgi:SPP1 family predicted phage head-tail adaptor